MKQKLVFVTPHLSTGGLPQYLYKQIVFFKDTYDIEVIECQDMGGNAFVVQKNKIKDVVKIHTCDNKDQILLFIEKIKPNIIHFQEIPEHYLPNAILDKIFSNDRNYYIVATTHGSFTNPLSIKYQPDRYVLVSQWSKQKFDVLNIENDIWEYPIEDYTYNKEQFKEKLYFDKSYKHILNVGLFTSGKNQGEIFKVAELLKDYKIKFHFVGNQAKNFESYWMPLMNNKPSNCIVWGERSDVDDFYKASDLFYFSSILELNPLSIKEALSYKLPSIFRKLETYLDTYDNNELVSYINDDINKTKELILNILQPELK